MDPAAHPSGESRAKFDTPADTDARADALTQAAGAGRHGGARSVAPGRRAALVAGAGGPLGSAVLEALLGGGVFARVGVLVDERSVAPALRGFHSVPLAALAQPGLVHADTAFVVFDRARHAHGREAAFHKPQPGGLPALAERLQRAGVAHLVVVMPHAPALLPQAFLQGLASLDEQAVVALGFEHVVFMRSAQAASAPHAPGRWLERVAAGVLAQLRWMVPPAEQPLRAQKIARFALDVARLLPAAPPGTRIASAALMWRHAQPLGGAAVVADWLAGRVAPSLPAPEPRR